MCAFAAKVVIACNNGVNQFKPIFQVDRNARRPIFFRLFHSCLTALELCRWKFSHNESLYQTLFDWNWIIFRKNWKIGFEPPFWGLWGSVRTPSIARWKARSRFPIVIIDRCLLRLRRYKRKSVEVGVFRRGSVNLRLNFRLKDYFCVNSYGSLDREWPY